MVDPPARVPDAIEPISAYRAWVYSIENGRAHLFPLTTGHGSSFGGWDGASSGWVTASCHRSGPAHRAPSEDCSCGFYSVKEVQEAIDLVGLLHLADRPTGVAPVVLGRILLSGKVIEHDIGYRAERARIAELIPFRGSERSIIVLANRLGVGMAAAVEPIPREHDEGVLHALSLRLPAPEAVAADAADAKAQIIMGVIAALSLLIAAVLLTTGAWIPPLGVVIAAVVTIGRSTDAMAEFFREGRGRRRRSGRLRLVPPVPPGR